MTRMKDWMKNHISNPRPPANPRRLMKDRLLLLLLVAVISLLFYITRIGCPIKAAAGIPCPGCGMTRALISALHLDFAAARHYHPLFWAVPVIALLLIFDIYLHPRLLKLLWGLLIAAFLLTYLLRMIAGG